MPQGGLWSRRFEIKRVPKGNRPSSGSDDFDTYDSHKPKNAPLIPRPKDTIMVDRDIELSRMGSGDLKSYHVNDPKKEEQRKSATSPPPAISPPLSSKPQTDDGSASDQDEFD